MREGGREGGRKEGGREEEERREGGRYTEVHTLNLQSDHTSWVIGDNEAANEIRQSTPHGTDNAVKHITPCRVC